MKDPKQRFSDRVDNYKKYRPGYPAPLISDLARICGLSPSSTIADIGSVTGIFTELLLERGFRVIAVEPNESMRKQAEADLAKYSAFLSVNACAEETGLASDSIDLITVCQAFHWFDRAKSKLEFKRILKADGHLALIWNERLSNTPFMTGYEKLLNQIPEYVASTHKNIGEKEIALYFSPNQFQILNYPNKQEFDLNGLKGRLLSSSYIPSENEKGHRELVEEINRLFRKYQENGKIDFNYGTTVYLGLFKN